MCGIVVALSASKAIDRDTFKSARDAMLHRGPDAAGAVFLQNDRVALGHRRLSILDLSAAANQPMYLGKLWVTFNGEIYNYPVLREQLEKRGCVFRTHSDTEVLLHGYRIWGSDLCGHLSGMFAFAIWDDQSNELFLARDHLGQKPLYYIQLRHQFVAASEIKGIRPQMLDSLKLRQESVLDNLLYDYVPEPFTWYEGVKCVLPGHRMLVRRRGSSFAYEEREYWSFRPDPDPPPISPKVALEGMGHEIESAVQSHLLADVEVGAFLSGGADSNCVVALASQCSPKPIKTFSIGFGSWDEDELPLARLAASKYGTIHREHLVKESDFHASADNVLEMFDQPFGDTSLVPTERVSAFASQHVKVVLTGDGGDEAFGGYNLGTYIAPAFDKKVRDKYRDRQGIRAVVKHLYKRAHFSLFGADSYQARESFPQYRESASKQIGFLGGGLAEALKSYDHTWIYEAYKVSGLDAFRQAQWYHLKFILPGKMLQKMDRCSMSHSLEARSPFLAHALVEYMLNLPTEIRNPDEDWYKGLFRSWLNDKIPREILEAPKRGFAVPNRWLPISSEQTATGALRRCVNGAFLKPEVVPTIIRKPKVLWKFLQVERALEKGLF